MIDQFSFGIGDRFGKQGKALLKAFQLANLKGIAITPVWNKSNREHETIDTEPESVRIEADEAVKALGWKGNYLVDADHINLDSVEKFIPHSDFYTIDVAEYIGKKADDPMIKAFVDFCKVFIGELSVPGIDQPFNITENLIKEYATIYLRAVAMASETYGKIKLLKDGDFVTEISMDEVAEAQKPLEIFFILAAIAFHKIPVDTFAPKFSGRFNKGVDYQGDLGQFEKEFEEDLSIIKFAIEKFGLKNNLKLSIHTGSDKFSIYPIMGKLIRKHDMGLHVKTAGTTWLEELAGVSMSGEKGLSFAKKIYQEAYERREALTKPYANVIEVKEEELPSADEVKNWDRHQFSESLIHDESNKKYNPSFRQLLHVGYKIAGENIKEFQELLKDNQLAEEYVTNNILRRHITPIFLDI